MTHDFHTIAATALVPVPEPEQCSAFLSGKAALGQLVPFGSVRLSMCCYGKLFFNWDRWIHAPILSTSRELSRPIDTLNCGYGMSIVLGGDKNMSMAADFCH